MADARSAWNDAGERLTELGQKLKTHYEQQHGTDGPQTREELAEAAKRLGGAVQDAFEAIGSAARDRSVQSEVKQVGQSVYDALGATFGQVSEELRRSFSATKGEAAAAARQRTVEEGSAPAPTSAAPTTEVPAAEGSTGPASPFDDPEGPPKVEPWGTP